MDSPGHCVQYCTYTVMENTSKKILTNKTLDKRMVERKSANMEKKVFQSSLEELQNRDITIKEVVTDAHLGIGALMSKLNLIFHQFFHGIIVIQVLYILLA